MNIHRIGSTRNIFVSNYMFSSNPIVRNFSRYPFFCGDLSTDSDTFEKTHEVKFHKTNFGDDFPKSFFKKLLDEGVPCAYTGLPMIARKDYERLRTSGIFRDNSFDAVRAIKPYEDALFPIEKEIFSILEFESEVHPKDNLQTLLIRKKEAAEKVLITSQINVINKILKYAESNLYGRDYGKFYVVYSKALEDIYKINSDTNNGFKRKAFIADLAELDLGDKNIKEKMIEYAQDLPQSSTSSYAFIVKYSQPYKFKYENDSILKVARNSEDIGLRLLKPSIATDEHIYPKTLYKSEEKARKKGEKWAMDLSDYKVTILTSDYINGVKNNMLFDDFVKACPYNVVLNVQAHVDRLIEICEKWLAQDKIEDAYRLSNYIRVLKDEFNLRSKLINPKIERLEEFAPLIQEKYEEHMELINLYKKDKDYEVLKNLK